MHNLFLMDTTDYLVDLSRWIIPSLVSLLAAYFIMHVFLDNELKKRQVDLKQHNVGVILPARMQAYERLTLFLERISPDSILPRIGVNNFSALELKQHLITEINTEYAHNVAMQVYLSTQAWIVIKDAKEQSINLINQSFIHIRPDATGLDLSKSILENVIQRNELPTHKALEFLKKEFQLMFM
jgi:hypothetical protein